VVLDDARHGHLVEMGEAVDALSARGPGTLAGLVLSGVVDRVPIEDLCRLLRVATRCLRPGAPLVVLSDGPAAVNGWAAVARDLWPGRPLHPDTWAVLLTRLGYRDVHRLTGAPEGSGGPTGSAYAVFGRTPA
jgi:hypothetical protein